MLQPSSERAACEWLNSRSATLELLGLETTRPLLLNKLYRTADLLWRHRDALERALCQRERVLFETTSALVFIDLTNVHYHGRAGGDLQFGRSKQRRDDCPLVTLGLSTEENIAWLRAHGYAWITVQRGGRKRPPQRSADAVFKTRKGDRAQAWTLCAEDLEDSAEEQPARDESAEQQPGAGEPAVARPDEEEQTAVDEADEEQQEARLCVWSQGRQAKDEAILKRQRSKFEQEVRDLHAGLSIKNRTKRYSKVLERLGRIKERHAKVTRQYEIQVRPGQQKKGKPRLAAAVTLRRRPQHAERSAQAGCYLLRTSHAEWDSERLVQTYWQLADIEATFRSLKSEVGLRPVYHRKPERVRGHLFIAVLAYHAIHLLLRRLKAGAHPRAGSQPGIGAPV